MLLEHISSINYTSIVLLLAVFFYLSLMLNLENVERELERWVLLERNSK